MAEQALDVGRMWAQARRHRLLLTSAVLLGVGLGVASVWPLPPAFTSESKVLLPPLPDNGGEAAERDGNTEVQVATSDVVLGPAGESLSPALSVRELSDHVSITAPTPDVLVIVAKAETARGAEAIAAAVADAELAYLGDAVENRSTTRAAVLSERQKSLEASLATVGDQIRETRERRAATGQDARAESADASALAQLTAEQANLVLALDEVRGLMNGVDVEDPATTIQEASPARRTVLALQLGLRGLAGGVVAVFLAAMLALLVGRRDRRLRFRDEVADALGTVVLASVSSCAPRSTAGWADLLARYEPGTIDAWALRQLLRELALDAGTPVDPSAPQRVPHPSSMTVISLAGDQRGLAMGPQVASYVAARGISARLVAAQGHDSAASLWAACGSGGHDIAGRPGLLVATRDRGSQRDLTVVLAVVDPKQPLLADLPSTEVTVLAVSSGVATAEELARVAVAADDGGRQIAGVILADPDDLDRTTGRRLHPERTHQVALPAHLTGVTSPSRGPGTISGIRGRA